MSIVLALLCSVTTSLAATQSSADPKGDPSHTVALTIGLSANPDSLVLTPLVDPARTLQTITINNSLNISINIITAYSTWLGLKVHVPVACTIEPHGSIQIVAETISRAHPMILDSSHAIEVMLEPPFGLIRVPLRCDMRSPIEVKPPVLDIAEYGPDNGKDIVLRAIDGCPFAIVATNLGPVWYRDPFLAMGDEAVEHVLRTNIDWPHRVGTVGYWVLQINRPDVPMVVIRIFPSGGPSARMGVRVIPFPPQPIYLGPVTDGTPVIGVFEFAAASRRDLDDVSCSGFRVRVRSTWDRPGGNGIWAILELTPNGITLGPHASWFWFDVFPNARIRYPVFSIIRSPSDSESPATPVSK